jgi:hypothetical protein
MHALLAIDAGRYEEADQVLHDALAAAPTVSRLAFVAHAEALGLHVLFTVAYTPSWAVGHCFRAGYGASRGGMKWR